MKCFTVEKDSVMTGIRILREPYPHVAVGDPSLTSADYRRVEIDAALVASDDTVRECSFMIDTKNSGNRRSSYKLVPSTGNDNDKALVKFDVHSPKTGQRTCYDFPRYTLALANGWRLAGQGPQAMTPVNLVVLNRGDEVKVHRMVDVHQPPVLVMSAGFDGTTLKISPGRAAA